MIGLSGLIDTLLSANSSPGPDVLAIKGEAEIAPPGPVLGVGKVGNDVRLPSNAALDRLMPAHGTDMPHAEGGPRSVQAELSVAARVISAVLADLHGDAGPVRGAAPAWPSAQAPSAAVLAGTLSQTVSDSGLFYESHLIEFTGGTRTLAEMAREPQASWSSPTPAGAAAVSAGSGEVLRQLAAPTDVSHVSPVIGSVDGGASVDSSVQGTQPRSSVTDIAGGAHGDAKAPVAPRLQGDGSAVAEPGPHPDLARIQAAYRWGEASPVAAPDSMPASKLADTAAARHVAPATRFAGHGRLQMERPGLAGRVDGLVDPSGGRRTRRARCRR